MESDPEEAFTGMIYIKTDGKTFAEVKGHAYYAEPGKDIVCAAVSTLYNTLLLALRQPSTYITMGWQGIQVKTTDTDAGYNEHLFQAFAMGCQAIAEEYPNNVRFEAV